MIKVTISKDGSHLATIESDLNGIDMIVAAMKNMLGAEHRISPTGDSVPKIVRSSVTRTRKSGIRRQWPRVIWNRENVAHLVDMIAEGKTSDEVSVDKFFLDQGIAPKSISWHYSVAVTPRSYKKMRFQKEVNQYLMDTLGVSRMDLVEKYRDAKQLNKG